MKDLEFWEGSRRMTLQLNTFGGSHIRRSLTSITSHHCCMGVFSLYAPHS